jgi:ABC-type lipoprotein export system ATPase subunit
MTGDGRATVTGIALEHAFPGGSLLFADLDFSITSGEVVALCGPSGSGKSTLLSIIATWVRPTRGEVRHKGVERIGWVFQNPHGVPGRTALDHVSFPFLAAGHSRAEAEDAAIAVMSLFGLASVAARPFKALSGGEAQRLMLARAVALAPDLLLVDEPTAQLDQRTAETVNATLAHLAAGGSAVVVATHDPRTRAACHRVIDLARRADRIAS